MLKIITGEAGTGKTTRLYDMMRETVKSGKKAVLFVPDQFSFEAEKALYKKLSDIPRSNIGAVRAAMFSREAKMILDRFGESKEYADDIVKKILMTRAVNEVSDELMYYGRQAGKPEFSDFALGIVSELRGAGLSPRDLIVKANTENTFSVTLSNKINDICAFYSRYDELLTVNFSDRLDDIRRAAELIRENDIYSDTVCFFDSFDRFSGNQLGFINALISKSAGAVFAITCNVDSRNDRRFLAANKLIGKLKLMSDEKAEIIRMTEKHRDCSDYTVTAARDMWQECDWICAEIRRLTDRGTRYRDIAVLSPDESYSQLLRSAMKKYGIPAFIDIPEPLISKSFVKFPLYALKALSFETDDILRYIKSGYVRVDEKTVRDTETDALEQFCRKYDLRRRDWLKPFPAGADKDGALEKLRKNIIDPLRKLERDMSGKDGAEMTRVLCGFVFNEMNMNRTIYGKCIVGREEDDPESGERGRSIVDRRRLDGYSSLLDDAITVFESLYKSLEGYYPAREEYMGILTDIFTATTVARPPQVLDAVTVGDTERSRFGSVKAAFICGFSSGLLPRPRAFSGAFTGSEGELLSASGIPIGDDRETRFSEEAFTVYRCVALPEEKLYMTYPLLDMSFGYIERSPQLSELIESRGIKVRGADEYGADFYCRTEEAAKRYFASTYSDIAKFSEKNALKETLPKEYSEMLTNSAESELPEKERRLLTKERAKKLLTLDTYSPTALEKLNGCRFDFFCRYGLRIYPPDEREVNPLLTGNVVHYCLYRLLHDYADKPDEFKALSWRQIYRHVLRSVESYERENYFGGFGGSERFSYMLRRLSLTAARTAERVQFEIKNGDFYPVRLEEKMSFDFGNIRIKGVCDRIDMAQRGGQKYIRVVDYKTGKKDMSLADAYGGSKLQMLLYLFGACEDFGAHPSSVMYSPAGSPETKTASGIDPKRDAEDSLKAYIKDHSMRGVLLTGSPEQEEALRLDKALTERYGKLARSSYIKAEQISENDFDALKNYCRSYINAIVAESVGGMIGSSAKDEKTCKNCDYKTICGRKADEKKE